MTATISFTCSEELEQFLEEEAERRMTTKSTVAQMIVADFASDVSVDSKTANTQVSPPETHEKKRQNAEDFSKGPVGEITEIDFGSKNKADQIRAQFGKWLSEADDKRFTHVRFREQTPVEIIERLQE